MKELKFVHNHVLNHCEPIVNSCFSELYERTGKGKGKYKGHPRTGHEGPEGE